MLQKTKLSETTCSRVKSLEKKACFVFYNYHTSIEALYFDDHAKHTKWQKPVRRTFDA